MSEKEQYIQATFLTPEIQREEKPFQWGDEKELSKEDVVLEEEIVKTYTSVVELLADEDENERKRLEKYFQEHLL